MPKNGKKVQFVSKSNLKKSLVGFLTLSTIGYFGFGSLSFVPETVGAKNVTVCASGCDFVEIQAGIDDVSADGGGTVDVKAGTYSERITMKSGVNVTGAGAGSSIITGPLKGSNNEKVTGASNAELSGFTITKTGAIDTGVYNSGVSPTIKDNVITGFDDSGVRNLSGAAPTIQDNEIYSNGGTGDAGIYSDGAGAIQIRGNEIHDNGSGTGYGIFHKDTSGLLYENNLYTNPTAGLYAEGSEAYVIKNTITGPSQVNGIEVRGGALKVIQNTIGEATKGNTSNGITVTTTPVSTMEIVANTIGFNGGGGGSGISVLIGGTYNITGNLVEYSSSSNIAIADGTATIRDNITRNAGTDSFGAGIQLLGGGAEIVSNVITENGTTTGSGIFDGTCGPSVNIHHNLVYANVGDGYQVDNTATCTGPTIRHNVFDNNGDDGIDTDDQETLTIHTNTITNNTGNGLVETGAGTPSDTYQNVFNNSAGNYSGWSAGTGSLSVNPLYLKDYFPSQAPFYALQSVSEGYGSGTSPLIDKAEPVPGLEDTLRPPGRGGVRGDIGAYAGDIQKPTAAPTEITIDGQAVANNGTVSVTTSTPKIAGMTGSDLLDAGNDIHVYLTEVDGAKVGEDTVLDINCAAVGCAATNEQKSSFEITTSSLGPEGTYVLKIVVVNKLGIVSDEYTVTVSVGSVNGAPSAATGTPATITDLRIAGFNVTDSTLELQWTAPDNGAGGAVDSYDVRFLHSYIADKNWNFGTRANYNITPSAPGTTESLVIPVNQAGTAGQKTDLDQDGLTDYMETFLWGTSPINQDTDGDGFSDATETFFGFSPLFAFPYKPDQDGDGLNDSWEDRHGLDKTKADTDGDGFDDKTELDNKFDPRNPDPKSNFFDKDRDSLTDFEERYIFGTNESHGDTDLDGHPDKLEVQAGYDPVKVYYFGIKAVNTNGNESGISNRISRYVY